MKKRQRRIAALLLACAVASVPVSQAFAETTYDVAAGVDAADPVPEGLPHEYRRGSDRGRRGGCGR